MRIILKQNISAKFGTRVVHNTKIISKYRVLDVLLLLDMIILIFFLPDTSP